MFDRHEVTIFPKENVSVVMKRLCVYACIFYSGIYLSFKTIAQCLLLFSHLYLINYTTNKLTSLVQHLN